MCSRPLWVMLLFWPLLDVCISIDDGYRPPFKVDPALDKGFVPPRVSEEEELSPRLSQHLQCDACRAVAFQFHLAYILAHSKQPSKQTTPLRELQLIEIIEQVCDASTYEDYSLAFVGRDQDDNEVGKGDKLPPTILVGPGLSNSRAAATNAGANVVSARNRGLHMKVAALCQAAQDMPDHFDSPEAVIYQNWQYFGGLEGVEAFLCKDMADPHRSHCLIGHGKN